MVSFSSIVSSIKSTISTFGESPIERTLRKDPDIISPTKTISPTALEEAGLTEAAAAGAGAVRRGGGRAPPIVEVVTEVEDIKDLEETLVSAGAPIEEAKVLTIREQIRQEAEVSGRGLTRLQIERRLGGGVGVSALRSGTERLRISDVTISDFLPKIRERTETQKEISIDVTTVKRPSFGEFLFGEAGKPFVGIDIFPKIVPSLQRKDVSAQEIQTFFRGAPGRAGFPVRVAAELIPTTPGEVLITAGLVGGAILAPPIVGTGISLGVTGLGVKGVLTTDLTLEQRTAAGVITGFGIVGAAAGVIPFVRGVGAKGVKVAPEGFKVIPEVKGVGDIGLIEPGKGARGLVDLPKESPLVKGGFARRPGGEQIFIGREQFLATSQRGFFKVGKDIKIEREFFVTPQEPFLKIPETRVSRLGLQEPFKIPEVTEIGFGLPKTPQIGITKGEVARAERRGAFAIGRGTELEAIKTIGVVTDIKKIGRTRIGGQGVDIFEFRTTIGKGRGRRIPTRDIISTERTTRISGETIISGFARRPTRGISRTTRLTEGISPPVSPPFRPTISPPIIKPPTISPPTSQQISPPLIPVVSPPIISPPTISPPRISLTRPPRRRGIAERKKKVKKVKKPKKRKTPIKPSFTSIVAELKGGLPEEVAGLGILPSRLRRL